MKIGIIGPNKLFNGNPEERKQLISDVAKIIAESNHEIVLTPDKDSLLVHFAKKYLEYGGKKINLIVPLDDDYEQYLDTTLGEIISCSTWQNQPSKFNEISDTFICIGHAWGGMKEIAHIQYSNKKIPTYIINEFISQKLPEELNFLVDYIDMKNLAETLKE